MILSNKQIIMALIRLRGCTGWSAPLLFAHPEDRFSRDQAHIDHSVVEPLDKTNMTLKIHHKTHHISLPKLNSTLSNTDSCSLFIDYNFNISTHTPFKQPSSHNKSQISQTNDCRNDALHTSICM